MRQPRQPIQYTVERTINGVPVTKEELRHMNVPPPPRVAELCKELHRKALAAKKRA